MEFGSRRDSAEVLRHRVKALELFQSENLVLIGRGEMRRNAVQRNLLHRKNPPHLIQCGWDRASNASHSRVDFEIHTHLAIPRIGESLVRAGHRDDESASHSRLILGRQAGTEQHDRAATCGGGDLHGLFDIGHPKDLGIVGEGFDNIGDAVPVAVGLHHGENPGAGTDAIPNKSQIPPQCAEVDFNPGAEIFRNWKCGHMVKVEVRGFEPLAFSLRTRRSTN